MCVHRGCRATRVEGGQCQRHGRLQHVAVLRHEARADGGAGRGINHLVGVALRGGDGDRADRRGDQRTGQDAARRSERGDATLFTRNDEVEAQWRICDPIVNTWASMPGPLPQYPAGSQGPPEAEALLLGDASWRMI